VNLLLDENLPQRWTEYLARFGITATHWANIGKVGDPDEFLFEYACEHNAVIITQDLDFTRLLALRGSQMPSVIQFRIHSPIPEIIGQALVKILHQHEEQLLRGCLISVDMDRHRLHLLPLQKAPLT
jgi:predicted nuclease of predicted toxin-antitoxin system